MSRRERAARQHLVRRAGDAGVVVRRLLAVQAQDWGAARLALRARTSALTATDVDARTAQGGDLVVGWLLRGTLHLVAREDYGWLLGLTAPGRAAANRRRLEQLGLGEAAADRAVAKAVAALAGGPLPRADLAVAMGTTGQATPHVLMRAALQGRVVSTGTHFALAGDWLGAEPAPQLDADARAAALRELGHRYLAGHAPATPEDLAHWSGLGLRDARAALTGARAPRAGVAPVPPRLLPAFDPWLLGWRTRDHAVAPEHARRVHPGGGMVRAVAIVDGRAVGTWTMPGGRVAIAPFAPLDDDVGAALAREAAEVEGF